MRLEWIDTEPLPHAMAKLAFVAVAFWLSAGLNSLPARRGLAPEIECVRVAVTYGRPDQYTELKFYSVSEACDLIDRNPDDFIVVHVDTDELDRKTAVDVARTLTATSCARVAVRGRAVTKGLLGALIENAALDYIWIDVQSKASEGACAEVFSGVVPSAIAVAIDPDVGTGLLVELAKSPHVRNLHIALSDILDAEAISALATSPTIDTLSLAYTLWGDSIRTMPVEQLEALTKIPTLTALDIDATDAVAEACFSILRRLESLAELRLSLNCQSSISFNECLVPSNCRVSLALFGEGRSGIATLQQKDLVVALRLQAEVELQKDDVRAISGMVNLERLDIHDRTDWIGDGLSEWSQLARLRSVALAGCAALPPSAFSWLQSSNSLEELNVAGCDGFGDEAIGRIRKLNGRGELVLRGCRRLSDHGLAAAARLRGIKRLDLSYCQNLGSETIQTLRTLPQLLELNLESAKCSNPGLWRELRISAAVANLTALPLSDDELIAILSESHVRDLDLTDCTSLRGSVLSALAENARLRRLVLSGCSGLQRSSLDSLGKSPSIEHLSLDGLASVDDRLLGVLAEMPSLCVLVVSGCDNISDEALTLLAKDAPHVRVIR